MTSTSNPLIIIIKIMFRAAVKTVLNTHQYANTRPVASSTFSATLLPNLQVRWATKMSGGKSKNGRDSNPKYLGLKVSSGEEVVPGNILVRQRGTKVHPGQGVGIGRDHTLYAQRNGYVHFERANVPARSGRILKQRLFAHVTQYRPLPPINDIR